MDKLPPSFQPGSGAADENALRSADLRHQGSTSVVPGYEGYKGPESSNWQYCQKLPPEASGQARVVSGQEAVRFSGGLRNPVIVVGPGEQFGPKTLEAPKGNQGGRFELSRLRKAGIRLGALAVAIASGLFIGGYSGNDNSASGNMNDICRRVAVQDGPQHYYDGDGALVGIGASKRDRQAIQGTLEELGRGEDLDYTVYGINTLDPEQVAVIEPGIVDVCVGRNGVSVTPAPSQESLPDLEVKEATILPGTAAEFNTLLPATPEGE